MGWKYTNTVGMFFNIQMYCHNFFFMHIVLTPLLDTLLRLRVIYYFFNEIFYFYIILCRRISLAQTCLLLLSKVSDNPQPFHIIYSSHIPFLSILRSIFIFCIRIKSLPITYYMLDYHTQTNCNLKLDAKLIQLTLSPSTIFKSNNFRGANMPVCIPCTCLSVIFTEHLLSLLQLHIFLLSLLRFIIDLYMY